MASKFGWKILTIISVFLGFNAAVNSNIQSSSQGTKPMSGVHLRIAVYNEPPIFSILKDPNNVTIDSYVGFAKYAFDLLSASLNFTYSFVEVTSAMVKKRGSVDEALNDQLLQNYADINGRLISPTAERLVYMDFTVSVTILEFALIQPMPQISNRFLAPVKPFQLTVWIFIFVSFGATVSILFLTSNWEKRKKRGRNPTTVQAISNNTFIAFSVLMSQGEYLPLNRLSFRLVAGSWCLIAVVLVYAYNSTLISYISLPVYDPVINTLEELVAHKTLRVSMAKGGIYAGNVLDAKTGILKTLGDSLRSNPQDLVLALPGELNKVLQSGCCAYFEVRKLGELLVYRNMKENGGNCQLTIGKTLNYYQVWTFGVAKHLPFLPIIDKEIQRLRQIGLITRFGASYSKSIDKCLAISEDRPKNSKLTLNDLASAFIVLGLGYSLSFFLFIIELLMSKCRKYFP